MINEKKKMQNKKTKSNIIVILLILAIIAAGILSYYAYSKYTSTLTGNGIATVAKWSFKVNGETEQFATIKLEDTMNSVNNVAEKKIAPGTSGAMLLELDGRGSEVAIDYCITIDVAKKPTNLKMYEQYADGNYSNEIVEKDGTITIKGTIPLEDVGTVQSKYIYWNWPYQTGSTENEIKSNDEVDTTQSALGTIELPITVTAIQKDPNEQPKLADLVSVGDRVNYNAASGNGAGKSYTTNSAATGDSSDTGTTFSSSDTMTWKVMSVDREEGTVELMAENPTANRVTLRGKTGYKNAETVLNDIGAVYGQGEGATGGRSITVEDVNKLENYKPTDDLATSKTYTSGTFINDDGTETVASADNPVTKSYTASTSAKSTDKSYSYRTTNFSGKPSFWLASRCLYLYSDNCYYYVRNVHSGDMYERDLCNSLGVEGEYTRAVLPIVSLKSNIQTSGKNESGVWNLKIE